jgi:uncharacterized protein
MLGLLQKHCPVCGMDVDKDAAVKRFGKYFCSEEHSKQYAEMKMAKDMDSRREDSGHGGGCC